VNRNSPEGLKKRLDDLLKKPENQVCADCFSKQPRWASSKLGVFMCIDCSGIHRNLGVHISFVRSVNLDSWTPEQVEMMETWGNARAKAYYEAEVPENYSRPKEGAAVREVQRWIRDKYEFKRFLPSDGHVPPPTAQKPRTTARPQAQASPSRAAVPKTTPPVSTAPLRAVGQTKAVPAQAAKPAAPAVQDLLDFTEPVPAPNLTVSMGPGAPQVAAPFPGGATPQHLQAAAAPATQSSFSSLPSQQPPAQHVTVGHALSPASTDPWGAPPALAFQPAPQPAVDSQQRHQEVTSNIMSMFSNPTQAQMPPMQTLAPSQAAATWQSSPMAQQQMLPSMVQQQRQQQPGAFPIHPSVHQGMMGVPTPALWGGGAGAAGIPGAAPPYGFPGMPQHHMPQTMMPQPQLQQSMMPPQHMPQTMMPPQLQQQQQHLQQQQQQHLQQQQQPSLFPGHF